MNTQINLRLQDSLLSKIKQESKKRGFATIQEFIKDSLRKTIYEESGIKNQELTFLKKLYKLSEEKNLYGTEKELFKKLDEK